MNNTLPVGKLARSRIAGSAALKMGINELGHKVKRPFMSREKRQESHDFLEDKNAKLLFEALTQLRGTALKVAQMLSMEVDLLPARYRQELEKSFHQVPPLNRVLVRKAITEALGQTPDKVFQRFDYQAFAAASLGQVHHAVLNSGEKVAVKIQYPGIHVAMENDMNLMKSFAKRMSNAHLMIQTLDEIKNRLLEEVDYTIEAKNTQWFKDNMQLDGVYVPKVFDDVSSQRLLTTQHLEGKHLDDWLATNPSQTQRDEMGQRLFDTFAHMAHSLLCLHADPNPGNYLFHDDGSLSLIDFGCVKRLSPEFIYTLPKLLVAYMDKDVDAIYQSYGQLGMHHTGNLEALYETTLKPFGEWISEPFRTKHYDFGKNKDYTSRGKEAIQRISKMSGVDKLADDFIFYDRTIYGLYKIFERMEARVHIWHH